MATDGNDLLNLGANASQNTSQQIMVVDGKVKLPEFFTENVDLWFWQVEAAFSAADVRSDAKKYYAIIGQLPASVIVKLADFRTNPPATGNMYQSLKDKIIKEYADSEQTKITKLLEDMPLGDQKPSQLLAKMRNRAANTAVTDNLLRQLWVRNLPETIRVILSTDDTTPINTMAETADRVQEAMKNGLLQSNRNINSLQQTTTPLAQTPSAQPNQTSSGNQINDLSSIVATLTQEVKQLRMSQRRPRNNVANQGESSKNNDKREFDFCWWHYVHRENAQKCKPPCKFNEMHGSKSGN